MSSEKGMHQPIAIPVNPTFWSDFAIMPCRNASAASGIDSHQK